MAASPQYMEQVQSNIPAWMQPYAAQLLGSVFGGQDPTTGQFMPGLVGQGYQPYMVPKRDDKGEIIKDDKGNPVLVPGQRVAEFSPMQEAAFRALAGRIDPKTGQPIVSPELTQAADIARRVGAASSYPAYTPATERNFYTDAPFREMATSFQNVAARPDTSFQMQGPQDITAREYTAPQMGDFERVASTYNYTPERVAAYQYAQLAMDPAERVRAERLKEYRMGPAALVGTEKFGLGAMQEYMSPYMQSVVERQKQAATRDYMRGLPAIGAAAARAGSRGGTREALLQSEAQRNLATQLGDIEAGGLQRAYEQSAGQFERDRAASMQAQLANQAAIQDVARQNLQAAMGIQSLGAGQSLEAQRLNQAMGLTVGQQNLAAEQARQQFMGQQSLQSQLANQQAFQRSAEFKAQQEMQAALANQQAGLTSGQQNLGAALQTQGLNAQQAMQAQLANQQMGFNVGQQNLAAAQARQQLGAQQAMQAGLANQQYGLQAALANQQAGLTVGQQNLAAQLGVQQLGSQQGLQAMLANQQAQLQQQQQALAQRQFGAQFGEQSRQFGANLGLQGIQQQLAAAGLLGNLGQQQFGQQSGINQAQLTAGTQMQQLEQARLQAAYEDFIARQRYPYQQLGFMSDLIRGTPTSGGIQTMYQSQPSMVNQIAGAGLGLAGLYGAGR